MSTTSRVPDLGPVGYAKKVNRYFSVDCGREVMGAICRVGLFPTTFESGSLVSLG